MNQKNTIMLAFFVALGVTLVAGLIVVPAIQQSFARTVICVDGKTVHACQVKDGQQGEIKSKGKRQGSGGINT